MRVSRQGQFCEFLSTPSARRATQLPVSGTRHWTISIHALREEGDLPKYRFSRRSEISIHALREEGDPPGKTKKSKGVKFLSTPSARRATAPRVFRPIA